MKNSHPPPDATDATGFSVAAFYKFVNLVDPIYLQVPLQACCERNAVRGTILLAEEGINGTIAGSHEGVRAVLAWLRSDPRLSDLVHKEAAAASQPFARMKVRIKREIVKLGVPHVDPSRMAGTYVKPEEWNNLLDDPDVVVVDVRNDYEVAIGTFEGSVNPLTKTFTELPEWARNTEVLREKGGRKPKVAMFCTGGIRCEKSTAFLRTEGFDEVYHLEGGILKYLETVPPEASRWKGECFVFDERVSVRHGVKQGEYELCRSCRYPLRAEDKESPFFVAGVSCARCHAQTTDTQKASFTERERQIAFAKKRNQLHVGARMEPKKARAAVPLAGAAMPRALIDPTLPVLYSFRRCPYAIRARLALVVSGHVCEVREVVLANKPAALLEASPKGTVPVLVTTEGKVIDESLDIMLWALRRHDPEHWLEPQHGATEGKDRDALIAECDGAFKYNLDRYKYPGRYEGSAATHRDEGAAFLLRLDAQLECSPYLFGQRPSLADMAVVPFVRQFAHTDETWFATQPWPALHRWLKAITEGTLFKRVMQQPR